LSFPYFENIRNISVVKPGATKEARGAARIDDPLGCRLPDRHSTSKDSIRPTASARSSWTQATTRAADRRKLTGNGTGPRIRALHAGIAQLVERRIRNA